MIDNNFLIKIGDGYPWITEFAAKLDIPMSSWYDVTRAMSNSQLIIMRRKNRPIGGIVVFMVYEIQLTKKGLEFLTRNDRA